MTWRPRCSEHPNNRLHHGIRAGAQFGLPKFHLGALGQAYAVSGDKNKAIEVLEELEEWSQRHYGAAFHMARIHAALGEIEQMFAWFVSAVPTVR
jgi:hypothetical protein